MKHFLKSYIIYVILSLSWVWGQCDGCNPGTTEYWNADFQPDSFDFVDCEEWVTNVENCNQGDLDVLQQFIDNSQGGENPPPSDLSPIELGSQVWEDGRLVSLCSSTASVFGCQTDYELSGGIPNSIGSLTNLTLLLLYANEFTGSIPPEIGSLTNLEGLDLSFSDLTGSIPPEIGNLTNLGGIALFSNQLTGSIPPEIGNLTNLAVLWLSQNQITGSIPSEIGELINLYWLKLDDNQLTGSIPPEIGNLTNLTELLLFQNQLTGSIPPEIGDLDSLAYLSLHHNQLTGAIPLEIGNLTNLTELYLDDNQLTGAIPPEIGELINLDWLKLDNNQFTGQIPDSICNLTIDFSYPYFDISNNQLCPPYPTCIEYYVGYQDTTNCSSCDEGYTEIYGECFYQSDLDVLQIFIDNSSETINWDLDTDSSGVIEPLELGVQGWNDGRITGLDCYFYDNDWNSCEISGEIPSEIENLLNLTSLNLDRNELTGTIPSEIGELTNLTSLDLWMNNLEGEIPSEIGNLTNLIGLRLGGNQLTGEIPSEIGNLKNLNYLNLYGNQLTGSIPPEIGNLTNLISLVLVGMQLTGVIPESICLLVDQGCNVSLDMNQLCPPYPDCLTEVAIGEQDITNCDQVSISEQPPPITYNLFSPYPNPFNPITSLRYDLPEQALVTLTVYDMLGREVTQLVNTTQEAGYRSVQWNATDSFGKPVSAGVYLYQIRAGEFVQTKKMVLLK